MPTRPYNDVAGKRRARMSSTGRAHAEVFTEAAKLAGDILALRIAKGLTQRQLAQLAGIDQADLSRIERGQANPTMATFEKLADVLNADLRIVARESAVA
jgi:DNA-binding XRE family transcriptional regulator